MLTRPFLECVLAAAALAAALVAGCDATATLPDQGPARPARLTFSIQPENAVVGGPMGPVAVTVLNNFGDTAFSSTASISLSIQLGTGNASAHLAGTTQLAAVNGTALFLNLSIDSAGTGYQLFAISSDLGGALSDSFDVARPAAGPAAHGSAATPRRASS